MSVPQYLLETTDAQSDERIYGSCVIGCLTQTGRRRDENGERELSQARTRSLSHSLTHSLTDTLTHAITHALTHSLVDSLTHSLTR